MWACSATERMRKVKNLMPRASSSPSTAWLVTFWSMTRRAGHAPVRDRQCSAKTSTPFAWAVLVRSALAYTRVWEAPSWAKKLSTLRVRCERRGT